MQYGTHRTVLVVSLAVLMISGFLGGKTMAAEPGPEASVAMLQKGIDEKDIALVEKYLDINAVVGSAVDQLLADEEIVREAGKNPVIALMLAMGGNKGGGEALRTVLAAEARSYVCYGVTSGAFAGDPGKNVGGYQSIFGNVFRGGEKDVKRFGPATIVSRGENVAVVATTLTDGVKNRVYPLELNMEKRDGIWLVAGLANKPAVKSGSKEAQ